ncbi:zinc-binding dehydrogenase, partial [Streptomyces sp. NPDC041003]|uniref:zinc-binding dehydrogenase n=1 Tax=Streptomyces sp. NPDC041003 TaxID=3155730 RepID=UPI0033CD0ADF
INDWLHQLIEGDEVLQSVDFSIIRERAAIGYLASGTIPAPALNHALVKNYAILGLHWGLYATKDPAAILACHTELTRLAAEGAVKPLVSERVPLAAAADAVQRLADGTTTGRLVVVPAQDGGPR